MTDSEGYIKVCRAADLKDSIGKRFLVDDVEVALFKVNNIIYALSNICPHQHSALIYDGFIDDGYVMCPSHGWEFSLEDGKMKTGSKGLDSYQVKLIDGYVFVKVYKKNLNW